MFQNKQKVVVVSSGDERRVIKVQAVSGVDAGRYPTVDTTGVTGRDQQVQIVSGGDETRFPKLQGLADARSTADSVISALTPAAWYSPFDQDTLWTDTGATTPVTAQWDAVARMDDKSGNGNHVVRFLAGNAPLWDGTDKLNYFWGTNTTTRHGSLSDATFSTIPRANNSGGVVFDVLSAGNAPILDFGTSQMAFCAGLAAGNAGGQTLRVFNGGSFVDTGLVFRARNNVLTWRSNGTNLLVNLNGTAATMTALSAANMTILYQGIFNGGLPKGMKLTEAVVCSSDMGATNAAALHSALTGLVDSQLSTHTVCVLGDSLSAGVGSEHGIPWHDYVTNRATSTWYAFAVDGGYIFAPNVTAAVAAGLKGSSEGIYHLWLGTNDIITGAKTGLQTAASLKAYSDTLRAAGGKVIVYTLQAFVTNNAERLACNAQIAVDSASYDAIVDLAANAALDDSSDTTYYTSDAVHLKDAGYAVVGALAQAAQAAL